MTTLLDDRFTKFGITPEAIQSGQPIQTSVMVYDIHQLRELLDHGLSDADRQAHVDALFQDVDAAGEDQELLQRVQSFVQGAGDLSTEDHEAVAPSFPLRANVFLASGPKTINSEWDISTPDGSYQIIEITDLTIEQGGYIVCRSTPLSFTCNTLTRTGNSGTNMSDFNILGRTPPTPPTPPPPGTAGQASKGKDGECSSAGIAGSGGQRGTDGFPGTPGTPGSPAANGTPSQPATIAITNTLTADRLTVFTQSGPGGQGGNGGAGGKGQQGGNGGDGVSCGCTGNGGGPGANGGQGGVGGAAGDGGNAVDAAGNVVVKVPSTSDIGKVLPASVPAPPGNPGMPGPGGDGGGGGGGGSGGKHNSGGGNGGSGGPGGTGAQGRAGTVSGKAAQVIVQVN
jgi:hypothetical protein